MKDVTGSVVDIYDSIADSYAGQYVTDASDAHWVDVFLASLPKGGRVLDAGCGAGQHAKYMHDMGFTVLGIDLSDKMLAIARSLCPQVPFEKMNISELTYTDGSFDGVLSSYSLIHVPDADVSRTLTGFFRVLKRDGAVAIFGQKGDADHYVDEPFAPGKKTFFNFFTPERIRGKLEKAGFSGITVQEVRCDDPYNMSDTNLIILAKKG